MGKRRGIVCSSVLIGLFSTAAWAQQSAPAYGVNGVSTLVVGAWDMQVANSGDTWSCCALTNLHRWLTNGGPLLGEVHLPQGAQILAIELESCDTSTNQGNRVFLYRVPVGGGAIELASIDTGNVAAPGCGTMAVDLASPETVENNTNRYSTFSFTGNLDSTTTLGAVRIFYKLQVSPAPATATFNDVPTSDPAFQFIEALVASGVTAGCGSGNYCPDAPLTRRQMAVFMSKALGLHWPDGPQF